MSSSFEKEVKSRGVKTFLDFVILSILLNGKHGAYDILAKIHENLGLLLSPGIIYSVLHEIEKKGLVKAESPPPGGRKFSITNKGIVWHKKMQKALTKFYDIISFFIYQQEKEEFSKVVKMLKPIE